jgi:hypothetical protein
MHRVHIKRFNLKKLNKVVCKEQYCVEMSNRFAAFQILDSELDINRVSETVKRDYQTFSQRESRLC